MILWFSGTGNSAYVARELAHQLDCEARFIPRTDASSITPEAGVKGPPLIFVFPVYSWGVPPIVLEFICSMPRGEGRQIYCLMTCGDETGLAPRMFRRHAGLRGWRVAGIWSVIMPNTYVFLPGFDVDSPQVEERKLTAVDSRIYEISQAIRKSHQGDDYISGSLAWFKTALIYPLFKRWGIIRSGWWHTAECTGCGICAKVCPVQNIKIMDGKPIYSDRCTSCLSCYHHCPQRAIRYGRFTDRKGQYLCRLKSQESKE